MFAAIIVAGLASVVCLSSSLERSRPQLPAGFSDTDLTLHGSRMKGFTFGMDGLIADWYYMRSLQYIGDKILAEQTENINLDDLRSLNPRLLYPMLDNATTLDPHFLGAFYYGAVVLPAIDGEQAIRLTLKGIEHNPETWQLYQHLGYIYWKLGRYDSAAEAYEKGSNISGAAPFMRLMAGAMRTEGGSRLTARRIFEQMLEGTDDPAVRITAERRIAQLDSLDEREAIDRVLSEFKERLGRCPNDLSEILPLLRTIVLPGNNAFRLDSANRLADPTGAPYLLDMETCSLKPGKGRTDLPTK
jgi:tetratricopeptide (TPR) repeat protein